MGDSSSTRGTSNPTLNEQDDRILPRTQPHGQASGVHLNHQYQNQYAQQSSGALRSEPFNMIQLSGALPNYQDFTGQRYTSTSSAPSYQLQHAQSFAGSPISPPGHNIAYANAFSAQYPGSYTMSHGPSAQSLQTNANAAAMYYNTSAYPTHTQPHIQGYHPQQNQYMPQSPVFPVMPGGQQYSGRGSMPFHLQQNQPRSKEQSIPQSYGQQGRSSSIASTNSSIVRGPPRKPRQSGHAIWIGNLPPQTALMDLVHHVCKETTGLESLFLISKSNCAFANFKDEAACSEAQAKIHDSRFQTVRLVSRLRRNSGSASTIATGVSSGAANTGRAESIEDYSPSATSESETPDTIVDTDTKPPQEVDGTSAPTDKFFIVKSLTVEDLELSVRNGIWATQSHNEEVLNKAFEQAENVYLVFSANKSGEYFGYARMVSPINDDPTAAIEFAPKAQPIEDPTGELPKAIATSASDSTPKGRIIDDSARGTIFWEAEREEGEDEEEEESARSEQEGEPPAKAWGKPFKVEWVSTTRLPFYKTRGLRNPWNSNREVKIARDGTELETSVGKRLLGLFHRVPSPIGPIPQMPSVQMMGGYPQHMQRFQ